MRVLTSSQLQINLLLLLTFHFVISACALTQRGSDQWGLFFGVFFLSLFIAFTCS